ncbi:MAG: hypothetical protein NVSMB5_23550 [Candidatus Velthaea sp.]
MKFVLAGLAAVAAVAALFIHPPRAAESVPPPEPLLAHRPAAVARVAPHVIVYVAGEVVHPGVYAFTHDARATDALARAGGAKPDADLVSVNLAALLHDGDEIAVPKVGAALPRARRSAPPRASRSHATRRTPRSRPHQRATTPVDTQPVDLNSATEAELQQLPGVGPALAARIVAYRESNGAFTAVDELADISGITPNLLDAIVPYATVR